METVVANAKSKSDAPERTQLYLQGRYRKRSGNATWYGTISGIRCQGQARMGVMLTPGMPDEHLVEDGPDLQKWEYVGGGVHIGTLEPRPKPEE